jgi:hypothetical protein
MRAPANGLDGPNSLRQAIKPGISTSAKSISSRPKSAWDRSFTLYSRPELVFSTERAMATEKKGLDLRCDTREMRKSGAVTIGEDGRRYKGNGRDLSRRILGFSGVWAVGMISEICLLFCVAGFFLSLMDSLQILT